MEAATIQKALLEELENSVIEDTGPWAASHVWAHDEALVGLLKRLEINEVIVTSVVRKDVAELSEEAKTILQLGSAEARTYNAVPTEGINKKDLEAVLGAGELAKIGFNQAMRAGWIAYDKPTDRVSRKLPDQPADTTRDSLQVVSAVGPAAVPPATLDALKKRKLVTLAKLKTFKVERGRQFATNWSEPRMLAELTPEVLQSGSWKDARFKDCNLNCLGLPPVAGHLHPLLKVRSEFREIFLEMGFEEMPTNNFVESSFWNFDALFQPQQHPARDAHDTFFLSEPAATPRLPADYVDRVKHVHQHGGYGSIGYRYDWAENESRKNLLRTHTTAVSSRMLYQLAQDGFKPKKYFSIDRVFRNEALDATHLAEFHQIEGLIADYDLTLANLMGVIAQFFQRLGIDKLRFKPAYNPYTEPSMEVFSYHEGLKKWVEIGNSGVFRPEMLRPMGMPEGVRVIAWGLSLERPTMIKYGISNIRDLVGHKLSLDFVKGNPICRLDQPAVRR
eukprot:TRINITY_DN3246_c0_g1_i3.p1 TRINITY_DN3246_c0_g1~~TRINITY_DN3246_c0_g1_i3.p1  ORF type:complete len:505 (+),score=162.45 TRINITY_DN3246_c0_g1_i3:911-2425(+)